jgi:hypothetical protein
MSGREALSTQAALMETALRLVDDHPHIAAGSVLRCFSRAVVLTRRAGTPARDVAPRAERLTRQLLAARSGAAAGTGRVPDQRDGSLLLCAAG